MHICLVRSVLTNFSLSPVPWLFICLYALISSHSIIQTLHLVWRGFSPFISANADKLTKGGREVGEIAEKGGRGVQDNPPPPKKKERKKEEETQ